MKVHHRVLTLAVAVAVSIPVTAIAESEFHLANGEIGYVHFPSHAKPSNVTRGQVVAEVQAARKESWFYDSQKYGIFPSTSVAAPKTRDEVLAEMRSESPAERSARIGQYRGGQ